MKNKLFSTVAQVDWLSEISGSFGDMGTLLPILVSLSATGQISLSASLVLGGIFNIISGLYFGIPMCVQPMKSIAAIALLSGLSKGEIAGAGLSVSVALVICSCTGLIKWFHASIPLYLIRGIQLGTGLSLISKGITNILNAKGWSFIGFDWADNNLIAALAFALVILTWRARFSASALIIFAVGLIIASTRVNIHTFSLGPAFPTPSSPSAHDLWIGFIKAGLGQLPLTISNSVIAVSVLADDLFPLKTDKRTDVTRISLWIAGMNLVGVWFGSLPYCCGSGGLAAQYRFGARTGYSVIFLGIVKMLAGLLFGNSLLALFRQIPITLLGVMLIIAGLQIALITVNLGSFNSMSKREDGYLVMILTAATIVGFANDGIGFLVGVFAALVLHYTNVDVDDLEVATVTGESCAVEVVDDAREAELEDKKTLTIVQ